ncbi:2-C-methyl-D-erythritol 4-phosphate cytidylyltransferase [Mucilaginibacter hurinus]|uniref:2-C-methyl-D-erythritol 4-phosphate cytidylyltransferase n=1 Tax=Mucilaginibacter hurinus TaxID=2201324 RepID=A0A367GTG1_9SPHI|nr:2-C-methyl-D-erythritol 4-phosphate cytidylyltransferase [Mucilaginibacter hurinus]RCH56375.1 2-C-methyl-D-erythritol 4-phosphate cytidylyltransferase [Mucilaginibacter hurinus]
MSDSSNLKFKTKAIIVAGGTGTRMQTAVPKQFLLINNRPVLFYTIEAFYQSTYKPEILLVLHADFHDYWKSLCVEHNFNIPHHLIAGGETRFHSVKNALDTITETDSVVAVHDAVRPLTDKNIIDESYRHAAEHGNAVTAVKSRDSVRQVRDGLSTALVRDDIYLVQTPQTFVATQLHQAYEQPFDNAFTDDASVVEKAGFKINLTKGDYTNLKITFPEDMAIAQMLLNKKPS